MSSEIFIDEFFDSEINAVMKKTQGYVDGEKAVLVEGSGHIILLDKKYVSLLQAHKIPSAIKGKLMSRNFIKDNGISDIDDISCAFMAKPEFFMIDLTKRCNMHCKYCLRDVSLEDESISTETVNDICNYIADYCNKYKLRDITIQPWGGEPLIELENILLIKKALSTLKTQVHFLIETNAILLDEHVTEILYKNKIEIGISIDGYSEVHDKQRVYKNGMGTHAVVERNLLLAQRWYGNHIGTITTVTKNNAGCIEEILEYYAIELGLKNVKFNYVHESMFTACKEICLTKEEIAATEIRLLNKLVELNENGFKISEQNISIKLKNILLRKYTDICHSCGCLGGRKMLVFDMSGRIFPCELTDVPTEAIGSIYDDSNLIEIVSESMKNKNFYIDKKTVRCMDCMWYFFCKGGCTVRTISAGKRPPEIDEVECAVNTVLYPRLLQLILSKPNVVNQLTKMKVC